MSEDIKDLLGRAFGDEPPLGIDREDVFEAGRKRLRRRRLIQSGSVVAAVMVAAVGAATLIAVNPNSGPGPTSLPPAATRTTEPSHSTTNDREQSSPPLTTTTTRAPVDAAELTARLYSVLSPSAVEGESELRPEFERKGDRYYFTADVKRPTGDGALTVTVEFDHPRDQAQCSDMPANVDGCSTQVVDGVTVAYGDYQYGSGERAFAAVAVLPGRVKVDAIASNYPGWQRQAKKKPTGEPVFSKKDLAEMLVRAGFGA